VGRKLHSFAISFTLASLIVLMISVWGIKKYIQNTNVEKQKVTNFNFSKIKRIAQKKSASVKKKKKKLKKKLKALKPNLNANLAGSSFGLDLGKLDQMGIDDELLGENGDVIMDENSVDTKPVALSRSGVTFPEKALNANISHGKVEIRMLIDQFGKIKNTEILESTPVGIFDDAAMAMVQNWTFSPAKYKGRSVSIWVKQMVKFGE
jgi:protein TonB